jgi:site-specific DNA recombinase
VVNAQEAEMVREIFESYLSLQSLLPVVQKLDQLGWTNKTWLTRQGRYKGGRPFDKCSLHALLTNVIYAGKIRHKDQIYAGQHEPIIEQKVFDAVQLQLKEHGRGKGQRLTNRHNALLKGLLYCPTCGYAMVHCPTKKKSKVYRYYVCQTAIKRGHSQCLTGSISAPPIETAVIESLRCIVDDEGVRRAVFEQSEQLLHQHQQRHELQLRQLTSQRSRDNAELKRMATEGETADLNDARRQDLKARLAKTQARIVEVEKDLEHLKQCRFGRSDVEEAVSDFDRLWAILRPKERVQLMELLVSRVHYDRFEGDLSITYHPTAISALIQNEVEAA